MPARKHASEYKSSSVMPMDTTNQITPPLPHPPRCHAQRIQTIESEYKKISLRKTNTIGIIRLSTMAVYQEWPNLRGESGP